MLSGKFNYHKIMFTLEVLESIEEKMAYITHIRKDIAKTIKCFETEKIVSLRMYGDETVHLEDNCPELQVFIQEMVKKYSPAIPDRRVPSNEQLRDLVKKEAQEYHKLDRIMEFYFLELKHDTDIITLEDEQNILNKALDASSQPKKNLPISENKEPINEDLTHPEVNITSSIETDNVNFTSSNQAEDEDENESDRKKEDIKNYKKKFLNEIDIKHKKEKDQPPQDDIVRDS